MARKMWKLELEVPQTRIRVAKLVWEIKVASTGPAPQLVTSIVIQQPWKMGK